MNQDPIGLEGGENLYAFAPNTQTWVEFLGLEKIITKGVIYRSSSNSNINLTPRPGKDTTTGLSASLDKQPGKCQAIYVSKLQGSGLETVNDHGRHVSIRPTIPINQSLFNGLILVKMLLQIHLSILRNYNKQSHRIILVPDHIGWYLAGVAEWGV